MLTITVTKIQSSSESDKAEVSSNAEQCEEKSILEITANENNKEKLDLNLTTKPITLDITDPDEFESELTSLTWLTELKNITNLAPSDCAVTDQQQQPTTRFNKFINQVRRSQESYQKFQEKYQTQYDEKPPFNYAQIIAMAMLEEPSGRLTLQQICQWIQNRFAYYKVHKNWNNSIRHNLSLNFFFTKIARSKNEKGKGGYWELAMDVSKSEKKRIRQRNKLGGSSPRKKTLITKEAKTCSSQDHTVNESSEDDHTVQSVQQEVQEDVLDAEKQLLFHQEQERIHELEESIKYILNDQETIGTENEEFTTELFNQEKFYRMIGETTETTYIQETPATTLYTFNNIEVGTNFVVQLPIQMKQSSTHAQHNLENNDSDDDRITVDDSGTLNFPNHQSNKLICLKGDEIVSEVLVSKTQPLHAVEEIIVPLLSNSNNGVNGNSDVTSEMQYSNLDDQTHDPVHETLLHSCGPNVIVESIPYSSIEHNGNFLPQMDTMDENELSRLILLNDHELVDKILDYDKGNEYF